MRLRSFLAAACFALSYPAISVALGAESHVVARQGPKAPEPKRFDSPMILEMPLARLTTMANRTTIEVSEATEYWCEDARITKLEIERRDGRGGSINFHFDGLLEVARSYDRTASVRFDVFSGDRLIATASRNDFKAEERETTPFRTSLALSKSALAALGASGAAPRLAVTVTLVRND